MIILLSAFGSASQLLPVYLFCLLLIGMIAVIRYSIHRIQAYRRKKHEQQLHIDNMHHDDWGEY